MDELCNTSHAVAVYRGLSDLPDTALNVGPAVKKEDGVSTLRQQRPDCFGSVRFTSCATHVIKTGLKSQKVGEREVKPDATLSVTSSARFDLL